jgi:hypothetical protein
MNRGVAKALGQPKMLLDKQPVVLDSQRIDTVRKSG